MIGTSILDKKGISVENQSRTNRITFRRNIRKIIYLNCDRKIYHHETVSRKNDSEYKQVFSYVADVVIRVFHA